MKIKYVCTILLYSGITLPSNLLIMTEKERFDYALADAQVSSFSKIDNHLIKIAPWNKCIKRDKGKNVVSSLMAISTAFHFFTSAEITNKLKAFLKSPKYQLTTSKNSIMDLSDLATNGVKLLLKTADLEFLAKMLDHPTNLTGSLRSFPIIKQETWRPSWVTVAPELQSFINKQKDQSFIPVTLDERLGLPHNKETIKVVVEMSIMPKNLIRPSIEANPLTQESYANFFDFENKKKLLYNMHIPLFDPYSESNATEAQREILAKEKLNSYFDWIQKNATDAYTGQSAMPWTQFGYTYDYSQKSFDNGDHFGFSEFIIKPGSTVKILGIYSLEAYASEYEATILNIYQLLYNDIRMLLTRLNNALQKKSDTKVPLKLYSDIMYFIRQLESFMHENSVLLSKQQLLQDLQLKAQAAYKDIQSLFVQTQPTINTSPRKTIAINA